MGGARPAREFTLDRFEVTARNRLAFDRARGFDCARQSLYLWGPCGVGKTHLAYAIAREAVIENHSVVVLRAPELTRKFRMKDPDQEQRGLDSLARAEVLVLDDLGMGTDTVFFRQVLQEILDLRHFAGRGGVVVTSKYSLDQLAQKWGDDSLPSRIAGMFAVILIGGPDRRLSRLERTGTSHR